MKENIGTKIKGVATAISVIEAIAIGFIGFYQMVLNEGSALVGLIVIGSGSLCVWVTYLLLSGYGEIIEKLYEIERNTRCERRDMQARQSGPAIVEEIDKKETDNEATGNEEADDEEDEQDILGEKVEYFNVDCPFCYKKLSFKKGTTALMCPYCNCQFKNNVSF